MIVMALEKIGTRMKVVEVEVEVEVGVEVWVAIQMELRCIIVKDEVEGKLTSK